MHNYLANSMNWRELTKISHKEGEEDQEKTIMRSFKLHELKCSVHYYAHGMMWHFRFFFVVVVFWRIFSI